MAGVNRADKPDDLGCAKYWPRQRLYRLRCLDEHEWLLDAVVAVYPLHGLAVGEGLATIQQNHQRRRRLSLSRNHSAGRGLRFPSGPRDRTRASSDLTKGLECFHDQQRD